MKAAAVLLSGGMDSATTLALARSWGYECHCLTVDYGQRHRAELEAARKVAESLKAASHSVVKVELATIARSALTSPSVPVPKDQTPGKGPIPPTYVPARNTVFLALLLAFAESVGAGDLFIGANALDYSGYPDCRPEYLRKFEELASLATKAGIEGKPFRIHAPLLHMTKAEIVKLGAELGVDFALTHSCYDPVDGGLPCGRCDSCKLRLKGFAEAGMIDPLPYPEGVVGDR